VSDCLGGKSGFCFDWDIFLFLQVAEAMAVGDQEGGARRNARRLRVVESGFVRPPSVEPGFGSIYCGHCTLQLVL
jgi:hypothetical protein